MKIFLALLMTCGSVLASDNFKTEFTVPVTEIDAHGTAGRVKDALRSAAARVMWLQVKDMGCTGRLDPADNKPNEKGEHPFTMSSPNCKIMAKKGTQCESGFLAKNMGPNPNAPDYEPLGAELKVCIKSEDGTGPAKVKNTK